MGSGYKEEKGGILKVVRGVCRVLILSFLVRTRVRSDDASLVTRIKIRHWSSSAGTCGLDESRGCFNSLKCMCMLKCITSLYYF
jgi:hypothetical protein